MAAVAYPRGSVLVLLVVVIGVEVEHRRGCGNNVLGGALVRGRKKAQEKREAVVDISTTSFGLLLSLFFRRIIYPVCLSGLSLVRRRGENRWS